MAYEIEAKMRLSGRRALLRRLEELGAARQGYVVQRDTFFDRTDGSLRAGDVGLRIREEFDACGGPARERLTYKGPRDGASQFKSRLEIEFGVEDARRARQFLEQLGFVATLAFEKRRELFLCRDCTVCLDEVVLVGQYVEVEGPDEAAVSGVREALGLGGEELVWESYAVLISRYLEREGLAGRQWYL
jgi:adenylate cyclase class 2